MSFPIKNNIEFQKKKQLGQYFSISLTNIAFP